MTLQQSDTYLATWFDNFKNKNTQHNITGLLFYNGGNIIQLFEGPVIETQQLFQNIIQDQRHQSLLLLLHKPITSRNFPDWNMEIVHTNTLHFDKLEKYLNTNDLSFESIIKTLFDSYLTTLPLVP